MTEPRPRFGWQRRALAANTGSPSAILVRLFKENPSDSVKGALAANVNTPPGILAHLAWTGIDQRVRAGVAGNTSTPVAAIAALTKDSASIVRDAANLNPMISPYLSKPLAPDSSARWPQTVESALSILLDDGGAAFVERVGSGASDCQSEVLAVLAHSQVVEVRARVAREDNADAQTLDFLAKTAGEDVQGNVARNRNTSASTLDYLGNLIVGRRPYTFNVRVYLLAQTVADNPNSSLETQATLARHGTRGVRERLAGNRRTEPEVLAGLAGDDSMAVIDAVAGNPSSPATALTALAAMALSVKEDLRGVLVTSTRASNVVISDLDRILGSGSTWGAVLGQVAQNPSTSAVTLAQLTEQGFGQYVARNPSAPPELRSLY